MKNIKIAALQEILSKAGVTTVNANLSQMDLVLEAVPDPIKTDLDNMIGELVVAHENNPVFAFGAVTALIAGASAVLKYVDLGNNE